MGHRVIQVESSYIILTGYAALNKVLGRAVYASNNQLGGVQIMHNNGVTHAVAPTDLEAIRTAVRWLSYVPKVGTPQVFLDCCQMALLCAQGTPQVFLGT